MVDKHSCRPISPGQTVCPRQDYQRMGTGLTCVFMSALWWSRGATSFPRRTGYGDERRFPVVLVAMDFTPSDRDRVKPFAFFGDAVATCLLGRGRVGLRLLSSAIRLDPAGLAGEGSFASRQQVAQAAYGAAFEHGGTPRRRWPRSSRPTFSSR